MMSTVEQGTDWQQWVDGLYDALDTRGDVSMATMVVLEQRMLRSKREHRCADCGDAGTERQTPSRFLAGVGHYWFCDECHAYWAAKS